jgi:hypothetical protein
MNILILGAMDCSGAGHALMTAINEYTEHKARMITLRQVRYHYPTDIICPTEEETRDWIHWADVLNLQVRGEKMIPDGSPKRPAVKTYHGSEYRRYYKRERAKCRRNGWLATCMTLDLSAYGATWIGRAMPDLSHMLNRDVGEFRIVHAAAPGRKHKTNRKGTDVLERALKGLDGVTADIFREVPNAECLARKAKAHLYIDQVGPRGLGYGTNALEAWAMGLPVVASAPMLTRELIVRQIGYLPFCPCSDVLSLRRRIKQFRDNLRFRQRWAYRGQQYVRQWHAPAYVAGEYVKLLERAVNG